MRVRVYYILAISISGRPVKRWVLDRIGSNFPFRINIYRVSHLYYKWYVLRPLGDRVRAR